MIFFLIKKKKEKRWGGGTVRRRAAQQAAFVLGCEMGGFILKHCCDCGSQSGRMWSYFILF